MALNCAKSVDADHAQSGHHANRIAHVAAKKNAEEDAAVDDPIEVSTVVTALTNMDAAVGSDPEDGGTDDDIFVPPVDDSMESGDSSSKGRKGGGKKGRKGKCECSKGSHGEVEPSSDVAEWADATGSMEPRNDSGRPTACWGDADWHGEEDVVFCCTDCGRLGHANSDADWHVEQDVLFSVLYGTCRACFIGKQLW
jgi:hypothetical protein